MFSRMFLLLVGALHLLCQVSAQDSFTAELMIESNVTLESSRVMAAINVTSLEVTDGAGKSHTVTLEQIELVAECVLIGDDTTCNCSAGYVWSDEVCYNHSCCTAEPCTQNVLPVVPLCVPAAGAHLVGTLEIGADWSESQLSIVKEEISKLNAMESYDMSSSGTTMEFRTTFNLMPNLSKFEEIIRNLTTQIPEKMAIQIEGLVNMDAPEKPVCYESDPELTCTLSVETEKASWKLGKSDGEVELKDGTVVKLNPRCTTAASCATLRLVKVTNTWEGNYTCEFLKGGVTYTAKILLEVAKLPERISMRAEPLTAECSASAGKPPEVQVTATIPPTAAHYQVWYSYNGDKKSNLENTTVNNQLVYKFKVQITCDKAIKSQYVNITFKNYKDQEQTSKLEIPVIYGGTIFCEEDYVDGEFWPKTPSKATVVNQTCPEGRTGFKTRTCEGPRWMDVFYYCVNQQLNNVLDEAEAGGNAPQKLTKILPSKFLKGQGPTSDIAKGIFQGLKNSSTFTADSEENTADAIVSISILDRMALASENTILQEDVLPDMVDAASQILNTTWRGVNETVLADMSANYLKSMEMLVNNVHVNRSKTLKTKNLELKICPEGNCNVTVFDIEVSVNRTSGRPKVMAVKNLMQKLKNTYPKTDITDYVLSATVGLDRDKNGTKKNRTSAVEIFMEFPIPGGNKQKPICVFWNVSTRSWSDEGCVLTSRSGNASSCHCYHLTSFSVLMAKGDVSSPELDIITNIGLGVSVCCLLIFLAIECLVWSAVVKTNLSHFRHTAIVNIATFRLLADCSFLASSSPEILSDSLCLAFTVAKHLFYTAMFCWMLCLSVMLVHQLIFVFNPLRKRVFMLLSSFVGYFVPVVIVGASYIYYKYTHKPYYNNKTCWLEYVRLLEGSLHAFLIPVLIVILINIFSMVVVIVTLVKTQMPDSGKADDKETAKSIIKVLVVLAPVFGVTWILGFFLNIVEADSPVFPVVNYGFTILNSFQGLFILFAGCFAEQKVREEALKIITGKGKSDASKSLTSTAFTKDK